MEKNKVYLVIAPAVVSLICIVLAVNAAVLSSKLNAEQAKAVSLNSQVVNLETKISQVKSDYEKQVRLTKDLQYSLDMARREADNARRDLETLRTEKTDLENRLSTALNALQGKTKKVGEQKPAVPSPEGPASTE